MALPTLKSIQHCADFSQTVEPFIPQLYDLPNKLLDNALSPGGLLHVYADTNPLVSAFAFSLFVGAGALVVSEVNRNYSQIDRLWSILPNFYIVHFALWARAAGVPHSRLDLVALFSCIWSARLTFNYWRKGGYNVGSEDYRWEILQKYVPKVIWFIFNVTFIAFIQSVLLMAFSAVPAYTILLTTQFEPQVTNADTFYFLIEILLVVSEWFSDGQQWEYQTTKHRYYKDGQMPAGYSQLELDRGFLVKGMWAYSRHPNFFAEQSIWFMLYQWASYASNTPYSWIFAGSGSLIALFQGSTWLTEAITAGKYPEYADYQKQVGMFLPTSFKPYQPPTQSVTPPQPKVIRTSELLKKHQQKEGAKQKST